MKRSRDHEVLRFPGQIPNLKPRSWPSAIRILQWMLLLLLFRDGPHFCTPAAEGSPGTGTGAFLQIQSEHGMIFLSAVESPLSQILKGIEAEFNIQAVGLEDRGAELITYTTRAPNLQEVMKGLMRHLRVKNYALVYDTERLSRISVFPEASKTSTPVITDSFSASWEPKPTEPPGAAEIQSIVDASQAQQMDLRKGDIILEYGGVKINRAADLVMESRKKTPEEEVEIVVLREGEPVRLSARGGFIGVRIKTVNMPVENPETRGR